MSKKIPLIPRRTTLANAFRFVKNPLPVLNEFVEEKGQVIVKKTKNGKPTTRFRALRGRADVRMTTEEILRLTRDSR